MQQYLHRVTGIFSHIQAAKMAIFRLVDLGVPLDRIQLMDNNAKVSEASALIKGNKISNEKAEHHVLRSWKDLTEVSLTRFNVSLFLTSTLIASLSLLGWSARQGAIKGAVEMVKVSSRRLYEKFSDFIRDAISIGHVVVVVKTLTQLETEIVQDAIKTFLDHGEDFKVA